MVLVPLDTFFKPCTSAAKDIESTSNSQVNLSMTRFVDEIEVCHCPCTTCIRDRDTAPIGEPGNQVHVDALLEAFVVGCMDEEFGTVRLEKFDVVYNVLISQPPPTPRGSPGRLIPLVISISVSVCHLFIATNQVSAFRRQLRSMTSLLLSLSNDKRTDSSRSRENLPLGKRNDVIMTYCLRILEETSHTQFRSFVRG